MTPPPAPLQPVAGRVVLIRREWQHFSAQVLVEPANVGPKMVPTVPQTQVLLQLSGAVDLTLNTDGRERRYHPGPGTLYLTSAHQPDYEMTWRATTAGQISFLELRLDDDLLAQTAAADAGLDAARLELRDGTELDDRLLGELCRGIHHELAQPEAHGPLYADTVARMLAMQLVRRHGTVRPWERSSRLATLSPRVLRRVQDHVRERLREPLRLEELATVAGLSPSYFCRAFRRATGQSPNGYVIAQRLARAAHLLRRTRLPVAVVAGEVGYANVRHFALLFGRRFGCSPVRWGGDRLR